MGPLGFYRHSEPYDHFTTAVQSGSIALDLAPYLHQLLSSTREFTVVDVGAGRGGLLMQLLTMIPEHRINDIRLIALDLRSRPAELPESIQWWQGDARLTCKELALGPGLLIAHEFLDDIPCELVEVDDHGQARTVMCDSTGQGMELGMPLKGPVDDREIDWLEHWWPATRPLMRVEVGSSRDQAWRSLTGWLTEGFAIAMDYAHVKSDRESGLWDAGTMLGYSRGRAVPPRICQHMNLTAHVAIDAVAQAASGSPRTQLIQQGPTPDFWWLIQTYGSLPHTT